MIDINDEINQQESNDILEVPKFDVADTEDVEKETEVVKQEDENDEFDITNDFRCAELLLDADEDRAAFEIFLDIATSGKDEEERKKAIDKLIYIAQKNYSNSKLLDASTWKKIEGLASKGKGCEYAYLLLHFKYNSNGENKSAYECLKKYFSCFGENERELSPVAYLRMGICLEWGYGFPEEKCSPAKAMEYYEKALDGGCLVAYRYIVCLYIFGGFGFDKNLVEAKERLEEGVTCFKEKFEKNDNEYKPFFKGLVGCFFKGGFVEDKELSEKGKELAQYMIDNGIKGGYDLMGLYFVNNQNITMARNYFEEAIKNNDPEAFGNLASIVYYTEPEMAYKLASKGCLVENDSFPFFLLGSMYEERGRHGYFEGDKVTSKKCYNKAWSYYEKAYDKFGTCSDNLGRLYFDKNILSKGRQDKLGLILEMGANMLNPESIKYYLRFIQRINKKDYDRVKVEIANELPDEYRKKYYYYLEIGAGTDDADLNFEYIKCKPDNEKIKHIKRWLEKEEFKLSVEQIEFVYNHADEKTKTKLFKKIVEGFPFDTFGNGEYIAFVNDYADEKTKKRLSKKILDSYRHFDISDIKFVYNHADEKIKARLFNQILKQFLRIEEIEFVYNNYADKKNRARLFTELIEYYYDRLEIVDFVCSHADDKTKAKLFKKMIEYYKDSDSSNDTIDYVYNYADKKIRAKLSRKLIEDSYVASSKKQLVDICRYYNGRQDDSFVFWFTKSASNLFFLDNKELLGNLKEIGDSIYNSGDESLKESRRVMQEKAKDDCYDKYGNTEDAHYGISDLLRLIGENDVINLNRAIENSKDEVLKETIKKITEQYLHYIEGLMDYINEEMDKDDLE